MSKCKSCEAQIAFVRMSDSGRPHPVNVPSKKMLVERGDGAYRVVDAYESHFATCPAAAEFHKPKHG